MGEPIIINETQDPSDINWENLQHTHSIKDKKLVFDLLSSITIFILFCYIIYNLKKASNVIIELFPPNDVCSNLLGLYEDHTSILINEAQAEYSIIENFLQQYHTWKLFNFIKLIFVRYNNNDKLKYYQSL